jgi:glycine/D-amino acid oxidase-like deaminating enzyme
VAPGLCVWGMLNAPGTGEAMTEPILDGTTPLRPSTPRNRG